MRLADLIDQYAAGPKLLCDLTRGLTREQAQARPVAGKWSTLEVICHLSDFEIVYADRMKRVLAETEPTMFGGDPDGFARRLAYHERELAEELSVIGSVRASMTRILRTLSDADFARVGNHNEAGPLTLEKLLTSVANHATHHATFVEEKRRMLGV